MKNKNQNSRICFSRDDLDIIKETLELWIKIENEISKNTKYTIADDILYNINYKYNDKKEKYNLCFNFLSLCRIHDALADGAIYYKKDVTKIKPLCKKIEEIIFKNYKELDVCNPVIIWDKLIKTKRE